MMVRSLYIFVGCLNCYFGEAVVVCWRKAKTAVKAIEYCLEDKVLKSGDLVNGQQLHLVSIWNKSYSFLHLVKLRSPFWILNAVWCATSIQQTEKSEPFARLQTGSHIWEEWLIFHPPISWNLGTNLEESFPSFLGPTKSEFWTTSKSSCICTKPSSSSKATWLWDLLVTKCCFWKSSNTSWKALMVLSSKLF